MDVRKRKRFELCGNILSSCVVLTGNDKRLISKLFGDNVHQLITCLLTIGNQLFYEINI